MFQAQPVFSAYTALVSAEVVRAIRGINAESVQAVVDSGQLRFVWNVAVGRSIPELRFLMREVTAPESTAKLTLAQVIQLILGQHRLQWRGPEVAQMLLVSRPCIHRLQKHRILPGHKKGHTLWFTRSALESFLLQRCLTAK